MSDKAKASLPPHSFESESALCGSLILDPSAIETICKKLDPSDFFCTQFRTVYRALVNIAPNVDLPLLKDELVRNGELEKAGGLDGLAAIVETVPTASNVEHYAKSVKDFARRRQLMRLVSNTAQKGEPLNGELDEIIRISHEIESPAEERRPKSIPEIRKELLEMGEVIAVPSSVPGLNEHISGGYKPRQLVIGGAFTGGGKTTWLMREGMDKAKNGHPVLYVSCELAAVELLKKFDLACRAGECISDDIPFKIEDRLVEFKDISICVTRWVDEVKGGKQPVVLVDYLQRVRSSDVKNSREREVAQVAEDLQTLAKSLNLIVICAAQLNRQSQEDNRPQLHHMRESGLIEQTGDLVLLISKQGDDRMNVNIGKNRWGTAGLDIDITVDYIGLQFAVTDETKYWIPLADRVVEYLQSTDSGTAQMRELVRGISWGGRGKHPTSQQISDAEKYTHAFKITKKHVALLHVIESDNTPASPK